MVTAGVKIDTAIVKNVRTRTAGNTNVRAGIVGAGLMGRWHAHALERAGGRVVGIADPDLSKAERLASRYWNAKAYESAEEMLADQLPDVLHICSPTQSHVPVATAAIENGVHVLVEKPIAATAKETSDLYGLASEHGALICPVHQFGFQSGVARAKKQLAKIGRLVHIEADVRSAGGAGLAGDALDVIADDILPHTLSLIDTFLDAPLSAVAWNVSRPAAGELRVSGQSTDVSLSIFISLNSRPTSNSLHLAGTNGTIHIDLFHGYATFEPGASSRARKILHPFDLAIRSFSGASVNLLRRTLRREPAYPGLRALIAEFYDSIRLAKASPISPDQAIEVARARDVLIARASHLQRNDRIF